MESRFADRSREGNSLFLRRIKARTKPSENLEVEETPGKLRDPRTGRPNDDLTSSHVSISQFVTVLSGGGSIDRPGKLGGAASVPQMYTFPTLTEPGFLSSAIIDTSGDWQAS